MTDLDLFIVFFDLFLILLAKFSHFTGDVLGLMNENISWWCSDGWIGINKAIDAFTKISHSKFWRNSSRWSLLDVRKHARTTSLCSCASWWCSDGWIGINKDIAAFIPGCTENYAGQKFLRLMSSCKLHELEILKEFIQMKPIGRQKTRTCHFSVLLRILVMLRRLDWYQQGHCCLHRVHGECCRCKIPPFDGVMQIAWLWNFGWIIP